jgi:hypothetical protein
VKAHRGEREAARLVVAFVAAGKGMMVSVDMRPASSPSDVSVPIPWHNLRLTTPHSRRFGRRPIFADDRRRVFPLEEFIHLRLHQDLIPQTRAGHPIGGERLVEPRGVDLTGIDP